MGEHQVGRMTCKDIFSYVFLCLFIPPRGPRISFYPSPLVPNLVFSPSNAHANQNFSSLKPIIFGFYRPPTIYHLPSTSVYGLRSPPQGQLSRLLHPRGQGAARARGGPALVQDGPDAHPGIHVLFLLLHTPAHISTV
jgi:hypothetical protein